jgi:hypothetical protein
MEKKNTDHLPVLEGMFTPFYYKTLPGRIYDEEMFDRIINSELQRIIQKSRNKKIDMLLDVTNTI